MIDPIPEIDTMGGENPDVPYVPPVGSIQSSIYSRALGNASGSLPVGVCALPEFTGNIGNVVSAIIHLEAAETATEGAILARYWLDGSHPETDKGFPVKAGDKIEIKGFANIKNTRLLSVDGLDHILQVQFYS